VAVASNYLTAPPPHPPWKLEEPPSPSAHIYIRCLSRHAPSHHTVCACCRSLLAALWSVHFGGAPFPWIFVRCLSRDRRFYLTSPGPDSSSV
jgi:hypothetical protein